MKGHLLLICICFLNSAVYCQDYSLNVSAGFSYRTSPLINNIPTDDFFSYKDNLDGIALTISPELRYGSILMYYQAHIRYDHVTSIDYYTDYYINDSLIFGMVIDDDLRELIVDQELGTLIRLKSSYSLGVSITRLNTNKTFINKYSGLDRSLEFYSFNIKSLHAFKKFTIYYGINFYPGNIPFLNLNTFSFTIGIKQSFRLFDYPKN